MFLINHHIPCVSSTIFSVSQTCAESISEANFLKKHNFNTFKYNKKINIDIYLDNKHSMFTYIIFYENMISRKTAFYMM